MTPDEHLAEAERYLRRADTFDDTERDVAPGMPGKWCMERRANDLAAANAHAMTALARLQMWRDTGAG